MNQNSGTNISQMLFNMDQSIGEEDGGLKAFINQSRLSTYFQDNPYETLTYSNKFQVPTLGGVAAKSHGSGHRPGNSFDLTGINQKGAAFVQDLPKPVEIQGIFVPRQMAEYGQETKSTLKKSL